MKDKAAAIRTGRSPIAIVLYLAAAVVALVGIALLIDNIYIYRSTIEQYVAQGYPAAEVKKSIIPAQLLPGIFDPVGVYGGIAFILIGIGVANKKLEKFLASQAGTESFPGESGSFVKETGSAAGEAEKQNGAESEGLEFVEPEDKK